MRPGKETIVMTQNNITTADELWEAAARCLPVLSPEEQRAGMVLLRELARGEPVATAQLAQALGTPVDGAEALVRDSTLTPDVHAGEGDRIQGFMGLSVVRTPHPHQLTVNGRSLWTWCAYDTLFIPELLDETAEIETRDPETGQLIHLTVSPARVEAAEPTSIVASIVGPQMWDHTSNARLRASACHFMFFFASRASGERWQAKHPETVLLSLDEAFAFGRRSNAHRFGAELARRRAGAA
jgi:alkylmercury lyase